MTDLDVIERAATLPHGHIYQLPRTALILEYRRAGWSQEAIMQQLGVGKSTVYRHPKGRVPRYSLRWAKREVRSPVAAYC
jgi:transcriptional regulator of acetoin/glycerol metabolism